MARIFVDALGKKWYAAQIKPGSVPIEIDDYILFNEDSGFSVCLSHLFSDQYVEWHEGDSLNVPEVVRTSKE
jgi:hypothetical protein